MEMETLEGLSAWFSGYVQTFKTAGPKMDRNILLKMEHTIRVRREIRELGESLCLDPEEIRTAEAAALLHDVGRFPQYALYKTFSDRRSCDHAALSVRVLRDEGVLEDLDPRERDLIVKAVSYHNRASIPEEESDDGCIFFSKLLRDADKLDVWSLLLDYYHRRAGEGYRNEALELDLPDGPGISEEVCRSLLAGEIVKVKDLRSQNDFKLLQASWIFDFNFRPALVAVRDRAYLERTREHLSRSEEVNRIFDLLESRLEERIKAERTPGPD
jgi:hypothetical protein